MILTSSDSLVLKSLRALVRSGSSSAVILLRRSVSTCGCIDPEGRSKIIDYSRQAGIKDAVGFRL